MAKVGLGITTYKRPDYFAQSVKTALTAKPDYLVIYNDGSPKGDYEEIYQEIKNKAHIIHAEENQGVAKGKNTLLQTLLLKGCGYLFLMEDDILIKSPQVFNRYIEAYEQRGLHHLNFAHHGPANEEGYQYSDGVVDYYPHCVGAFSFYTRECLEAVGLMDENFYNALEHIEHTKRIGDAGFTSPFGAFADVTGSQKLLTEIPGSIERSSIRNNKSWMDRIKKGLDYWRSIDPTCPVEFEFERKADEKN